MEEEACWDMRVVREIWNAAGLSHSTHFLKVFAWAFSLFTLGQLLTYLCFIFFICIRQSIVPPWWDCSDDQVNYVKHLAKYLSHNIYSSVNYIYYIFNHVKHTCHTVLIQVLIIFILCRFKNVFLVGYWKRENEWNKQTKLYSLDISYLFWIFISHLCIYLLFYLKPILNVEEKLALPLRVKLKPKVYLSHTLFVPLHTAFFWHCKLSEDIKTKWSKHHFRLACLILCAGAHSGWKRTRTASLGWARGRCRYKRGFWETGSNAHIVKCTHLTLKMGNLIETLKDPRRGSSTLRERERDSKSLQN